MFKARVIAPYNLMKQDIAIRIFETANLEARVYSDLVKKVSDLIPDFFSFIESFRGLFNMTIEQLKGNPKTRKEFEEFFEKVMEELNEVSEEDVYTVVAVLAKEAIQKYRKYKQKLKEAGILDIRTFELKPEHAWRESI